MVRNQEGVQQIKQCINAKLLYVACCAYSLVSVPMYDTFDAEALQYIIINTSITTVVVGVHLLERLLSIANATSVMKVSAFNYPFDATRNAKFLPSNAENSTKHVGY